MNKLISILFILAVAFSSSSPAQPNLDVYSGVKQHPSIAQRFYSAEIFLLHVLTIDDVKWASEAQLESPSNDPWQSIYITGAGDHLYLTTNQGKVFSQALNAEGLPDGALTDITAEVLENTSDNNNVAGLEFAAEQNLFLANVANQLITFKVNGHVVEESVVYTADDFVIPNLSSGSFVQTNGEIYTSQGQVYRYQNDRVQAPVLIEALWGSVDMFSHQNSLYTYKANQLYITDFPLTDSPTFEAIGGENAWVPDYADNTSGAVFIGYSEEFQSGHQNFSIYNPQTDTENQAFLTAEDQYDRLMQGIQYTSAAAQPIIAGDVVWLGPRKFDLTANKIGFQNPIEVSTRYMIEVESERKNTVVAPESLSSFDHVFQFGIVNFVEAQQEVVDEDGATSTTSVFSRTVRSLMVNNDWAQIEHTDTVLLGSDEPVELLVAVVSDRVESSPVTAPTFEYYLQTYHNDTLIDQVLLQDSLGVTEQAISADGTEVFFITKQPDTESEAGYKLVLKGCPIANDGVIGTCVTLVDNATVEENEETGPVIKLDEHAYLMQYQDGVVLHENGSISNSTAETTHTMPTYFTRQVVTTTTVEENGAVVVTQTTQWLNQTWSLPISETKQNYRLFISPVEQRLFAFFSEDNSTYELLDDETVVELVTYNSFIPDALSYNPATGTVLAQGGLLFYYNFADAYSNELGAFTYLQAPSQVNENFGRAFLLSDDRAVIIDSNSAAGIKLIDFEIPFSLASIVEPAEVSQQQTVEFDLTSVFLNPDAEAMVQLAMFNLLTEAELFDGVVEFEVDKTTALQFDQLAPFRLVVEYDGWSFQHSLKTKVININEAPVAIELSTQTLKVGEAYGGSVADVFTDPDNDVMTFTATGFPAGIVFDSETYGIAGRPTEAGEFLITLSATDTSGLTTETTYTLLVSDPEEEDNSGSMNLIWLLAGLSLIRLRRKAKVIN
ncbi:putative Ig domain-containing protein [Psychrosphaera ytuae]|uniref:Ig domain-containing protein n=1 Tax=Psychrosphaera ytuae TaxID=2820710 RepID=A0A975DDE2_9GAMM|nr:putative Ig domain-containing protein [Psychrosphaera ytuae]QTH64644.1 putative Ig domain-containing protein [Psychrosphaera ytuae]